MSYNPAWPQEVDVSFLRGTVLLTILFFLPHLALSWAFSLGFPSNIVTVKHGFLSVLIYSLVFVAAAATLKLIGQISVWSYFRVERPLPVEYLVCITVGTILGFIQFYAAVPYGRRLPDYEYVLFIFGGLLLKAVLWPLIEETIFRGIGFVALYNYSKSRPMAYLGSTLLFTLFHAPSLPDLLFKATIGVSNTHLILIVSFSLFSAFIYEKTGKLLLCVFAHGVVNGMEFLGVVVGYVVDFPLPDDWPGN